MLLGTSAVSLTPPQPQHSVSAQLLGEATDDGSFARWASSSGRVQRLPLSGNSSSGVADTCNTGFSAVPCAKSLSITYLNLLKRTDRKEHMKSMLSAIRDPQGMLAGTAFRSPGIVAKCPNAHDMCSVSPDSILDAHALFEMEKNPAYLETARAQAAEEGKPPPESYMQLMSATRRQGTWGCFAAHVSALAEYNRSRETPFRLMLEDDVVLTDGFLPAVADALAQLPKRDAWHIVRFGISNWGQPKSKDEKDRIFNGSNVFRALEQPYQPRLMGELYMGGHAVLVQRETIAELLDHIMRMGLVDVDITYKEQPQGFDASFSSFAVDTPAVYLKDFGSSRDPGRKNSPSTKKTHFRDLSFDGRHQDA